MRTVEYYSTRTQEGFTVLTHRLLPPSSGCQPVQPKGSPATACCCPHLLCCTDSRRCCSGATMVAEAVRDGASPVYCPTALLVTRAAAARSAHRTVGWPTCITDSSPKTGLLLQYREAGTRLVPPNYHLTLGIKMTDTLIEISQNLASRSHTCINKLSYNHCLKKL